MSPWQRSKLKSKVGLMVSDQLSFCNISAAQKIKQVAGIRNGFTLIEILLVVSLSVIIISSLYAVYLVSYKAYQRNVSRAELDQNARISLERVTRDLRQTNQVISVLAPTETDPLNPPSSHLVFQDGHDTSKIQYIEYSLEDGNLKRYVRHYYFSSDPTTWVSWNSKDQYGNSPLESIDENVIKADEVQSLKFFGSLPIITMKIVVSDSINQFTYQTDILGRNIQ